MRISTICSLVLSSRAAISVTAATGELIAIIITGIGPISSSYTQQKNLVSWIPNALEAHAKVSASKGLELPKFSIQSAYF